MSTYMMRGVDSELWRTFKAKAAADDLPLRGLLLWFVRLYVRHGLTAFEALGGKFPR
jgi:hypothetical protein